MGNSNWNGALLQSPSSPRGAAFKPHQHPYETTPWSVFWCPLVGLPGPRKGTHRVDPSTRGVASVPKSSRSPLRRYACFYGSPTGLLEATLGGRVGVLTWPVDRRAYGASLRVGDPNTTPLHSGRGRAGKALR